MNKYILTGHTFFRGKPTSIATEQTTFIIQQHILVALNQLKQFKCQNAEAKTRKKKKSSATQAGVWSELPSLVEGLRPSGGSSTWTNAILGSNLDVQALPMAFTTSHYGSNLTPERGRSSLLRAGDQRPGLLGFFASVRRHRRDRWWK